MLWLYLNSYLGNKSNDYARWKGSDEGARERINKKIVVPIGRQTFTAQEGSTFFAMGSCFARNVEERLALAGANVLSLDIEMDDLGATVIPPKISGAQK